MAAISGGFHRFIITPQCLFIRRKSENIKHLLKSRCFFHVCPAWVQSNGCKSRVWVDSAKHIAKGKDVHREVESEGSRRQTSGLTNRNRIRHGGLGKVA